MENTEITHLLLLLAIMLGAARIFGALAKIAGQPAGLGEMLAGVVLGKSILGLVNPELETLHFLSELGVVLLLFSIGLETNLNRLLRIGGTAVTVAIAGVILPFALGYAVCRLMGLADLPSVVAGAALTATSVGITARVLADLGRLQEPEGQVILAAAVIDDVIGLVILTIVSSLTRGDAVSLSSVARSTVLVVGFLVASLVVGQVVVPRLFRVAGRIKIPGTSSILALVFALLLAYLADRSGSALILGAFAAGLIVRLAPQAERIETDTHVIGHILIPLFFVAVGAAVDLGTLSPFDAQNRTTLKVGGLLIVAAVAGKMLAGYAPFWFPGRKSVIGAGMIPRGEVGLIFAQMGLTNGVLNARLFGAVMLMVVVTTFLAPPFLKLLCSPSGESSRHRESSEHDEHQKRPAHQEREGFS
jgi:Kef-type K+ transport system membrane component KefB